VEETDLIGWSRYFQRLVLSSSKDVPMLELILLASLACGQTPTSDALQSWLGPQRWERETAGPIVSLGRQGQFDDTHLFAPTVTRENDRFQLWYCGSRGTVAQRVFHLGLAESSDGREFTKAKGNPVYQFGDDRHSILTPCVLTASDGSPIRENGKLRMWFSSTWFEGDTGLHTLHDTTSADGVSWASPSEPLLKNVYAPSIIKTDSGYEMWYTDVGAAVWIIRRAVSQDGKSWRPDKEPAITIDQAWERTRLFYPCVRRIQDQATGKPIYLMWYGAYWKARAATTALGFAVSENGVDWKKHPQNPVLRPDPKRAWESHYVTSESVHIRNDGSLQIWYASRKQPPFINKYFALNTAVWRRANQKEKP